MPSNVRVFVALLALTGCATARTNPLNRDVTDAFKCDRAQIEQEWATNRYKAVAAGSDACVALGRFGLPDHMTQNNYPGSVSALMTWTANHQVSSAIFKKYFDTPDNRRLGFPIDRWVVENFSVTSF